MRFLRHVAALALASGAAALGQGCFLEDGLAPPADAFYFPTALAVSKGRTALYVVNSDFDLQYRGGTVQVLNLPALRSKSGGVLDLLGKLQAPNPDLGSICRGLGLQPNDNDVLDPGPCTAFDSAKGCNDAGQGCAFITKTATIGAFASSATLAYRPDGAGARLFVAVRGDPSITYFDVQDDRAATNPTTDPLDCGQGVAGGVCTPFHKVGSNPYDNVRRLSLPIEPVSVVGDDDGTALLVAHQTERSVSLVTNDWSSRPTLQFFLTSLPDGPTELAKIPRPRLMALAEKAATSSGARDPFTPAWLLAYRNAPEVDVLRSDADQGASPPRPFVTRAGGFGINVASPGSDSRGVAIDGSERAACESACGTDTACLLGCTAIPLRAYVANRTPPALLVGRIETTIVRAGDGTPTSSFDIVRFTDQVPLSFGASKVALGDVIGQDGRLHKHVFAVTFESRYVFSYDPEAGAVDAVIRTGRGPHAITFDTGDDGDGLHSLLFVGHFTDSYLGVVDLDMRHATFGSMFAAIGVPTAPKESK